MTHAIEECPHCGANIRRTRLGSEPIRVDVVGVGPIYGYDKRDLVVCNPDSSVRLRESLFDNGLEAYTVHLCAGLVRATEELRRCKA